ncbi:MAG: hypothetical protein IJT77_02795 [Clostridia bacterium]|nr:hypothetical protein [Clostridia bacterium]
MTIIGVLMCALSVAVFMHSGFGLDPFQCASQGIFRVFTGRVSFGTFYMIWSFVLLIVDLFLDRSQIGITTFANLFLLGYMVDASKAMLEHLFPAPGLVLRIVMLIMGVVIVCIAASLYFTSNQGVSVYDAISKGLSARGFAIAGHVIPFKYIRISTDIICVLIGMVFGLLPGIGTLISAFFMGPLIDWFCVHLAQPLLGEKKAA